MKVVKRFIAGAVCPRCGEMDKLVTYQTEEGSYKECVACDFSEKQLVQVAQSELPTRVNQYEPEASDSQPLKILDPKKTERNKK